MQTIIRIRQIGRMGNHMVQLMFATDVQRLCKYPVEIQGYDLPEWQLKGPPANKTPSKISAGSNLLHTQYLATLIDRFKPQCLDLSWVVLRAGNFSEPDKYSVLFPRDDDGVETPDDRLLVSIRLGDVSTLIHDNYGPLPISYYRYLQQKTGLQLRFTGELDDSLYFNSLKKAFPDAEFVGGISPRSDFQTIRRAKNIAISVSSFSWLAAFLSNARAIHVPIAGLIDPRVRPDVDMLFARDNRYFFHEISQSAWANRYTDYHATGSSYRQMQNDEVIRLKKDAAKKMWIATMRTHFGLTRRMIFFGSLSNLE